jgi:hypothetical protein
VGAVFKVQSQELDFSLCDTKTKTKTNRQIRRETCIPSVLNFVTVGRLKINKRTIVH